MVFFWVFLSFVQNMGKGSLWRVEQQYKQNLVIALTRSSYHPNTTAMEKATASFKTTPRSSESPPLVKATNTARPLDAELFPRLSKFMANMANGSGAANMSSGGSSETRSPLADDDYSMHNGNVECLVVNGERVSSTHHDENDPETHAISVERIARDWGVDNIDDVNAATAMLALKHGPKIFAETFHTGYVHRVLFFLPLCFSFKCRIFVHLNRTPIITSVPSEDHTYSAGKRASNSNGTSIQSNNNNVNITNNNTVTCGGGGSGLNAGPDTINHKITVSNDSPINIITTSNTVHNNNNNVNIANNNNNNNNIANNNIINSNNTNNILNRSHLNNSDNTSNGTSSDAAYESSEER